MKQSQFASFRASRYPTFSSLARLNLVLPACGREWKETTLKEVPQLLNQSCSWAFVPIAWFATTPVGIFQHLQSSNCTECPTTLGTASEWPMVSPASAHHKHTQPGPGKAVLSWAPQVWVLHGLTALLPPVLESPSGSTTEEGSLQSRKWCSIQWGSWKFFFKKEKTNPHINPMLISPQMSEPLPWTIYTCPLSLEGSNTQSVPVFPQLTHRWQSGSEKQVSSFLPPPYNLILLLQGACS